MAVPTLQHMKLIDGTDSGATTIYTSGLIKIGDTINIGNSANNDGIFSVHDISINGTDVYFLLRGRTVITETGDVAGITIQVQRAPGDKLVAFGRADEISSKTYGVDVWSYNKAGAGGTLAENDGWTQSVINPTFSGSDAKYIFHFADEALRVCNKNAQNSTMIKWYGYIERNQFGLDEGLSFNEWQEHPNTLQPPVLGASGSVLYSFGYLNGASGSEHDGSNQATNFYKNNRGVAYKQIGDDGALQFDAVEYLELSDMLSSAQKTFFADILGDNDNVFDFGGNNADGNSNLIDGDGFVATNSTEFVVSSGGGLMTNTGTNYGNVYLPIITVIGESYTVYFDVVAAIGDSNVKMSLSATTSYNTGADSGTQDTGTNITLANPFTATGTTSYLHITNILNTNDQISTVDSIRIRRTSSIIFEDATGEDNTVDQSFPGDVNTVGTALGAAVNEYIFCKKPAGTGTTITFSREYGEPGSQVVYTDNLGNVLTRGAAFNIGVTESTTDSGLWQSNTWEFYQTFIYDGNQESLPVQVSDGESSIAGGYLGATTGNLALTVSTFWDLAYNGRISGGRAYIREKGSEDPLTLLLDIDIVKGARTSMLDDYTPWTLEVGDGFFVSSLKSIGPNIDTYTSLNGFSSEESFISIGKYGEMYEASTVAGRRSFIANIRLQDKNNQLRKYGDRIMYSEINKFDTFLESNFIDVSKGDFGEYVSLESFADRLLAFKHNLVHIINISNPNPSAWFLEETVGKSGVSHPFNVTKTELGIAWVSESGCFLYDGERVSNLIEGKLAFSDSTTGLLNDWVTYFNGSVNVKDVMIGYDSISNALIIMRSPNDATTNSNLCLIYDFNSGGWTSNDNMFTEDNYYTNFIHDWNNNLVLAHQTDTETIALKKYLPVSTAQSGQILVTRDIDFGQPAVKKKIYKVIVTYKSSVDEATPLEYSVDGKQSFSDFSTGSNVSPAGDSSGDLDAQTVWDVGVFTADSVVTCQSIQFKFNPPDSGKFEINDITIEYRPLGRSTVT